MIKNRKKELIFLIFASIFQNIYFNYVNKIEVDFVFVLGLNDENQFSYMEILVLFLPLFFALMFFSERSTKSLEGYGRLLMIRNVSRKKMIFIEFKKILYDSVLIFVLQFLIGCIFCEKISLNIIENICVLMLSYVFTLFLVAIIQFLGEFFFSAASVNLIMNGYVLLSMFAKMLFKVKKMNILFFSANIFGSVNGILYKNVKTNIQLYSLITISIVMIYRIIIRCFENKDIY